MYSSIRGNFAEAEGFTVGESILDSKAKDLTRNKNKVEDKTLDALKKEQERLDKEKEKRRKKKEKMSNPWNKVMSRWAVLGPTKVSNVDAEKGKAFNRSEVGDLEYAFLHQGTKNLDTVAQAAVASAAAQARLKFQKEVSKPKRHRRRRRRSGDEITDPELLRLKMEEENNKLYQPTKPAGPAGKRETTIKFIGDGSNNTDLFGDDNIGDDDGRFGDAKAQALQKNALRGIRALKIASKTIAALATRHEYNWQTRIQLFPHPKIDVFFDANDTASPSTGLRPLVSQWVLDIHRALDRPYFLWLADWKEAESKLFCIDGKISYMDQLQKQLGRVSSTMSSNNTFNNSTTRTLSNVSSNVSSKPFGSTPSANSINSNNNNKDKTDDLSALRGAKEVSELSFMGNDSGISRENFGSSSFNMIPTISAEAQKKLSMTSKQWNEYIERKVKKENRQNNIRASAGLYCNNRLPIHHPDRDSIENIPERLPQLSVTTRENFFYPHKVASVDPRSSRDLAQLRPSVRNLTGELRLGDQKTHLACPTIQQVMQTTWLSAEIQKSGANQRLLDVVFAKHERTLGRVVARVFFASLNGERSLLLGLNQFKDFAKKAKVGIVDVDPWRQYGITRDDDNLEDLVKRASNGDHQALREVRAAVAAASQRDKEQHELKRRRSMTSKKDLLAKNTPDYVNDMKDKNNDKTKNNGGGGGNAFAQHQQEASTGVLALLPILYHQLCKPYNGLSIASFTLALIFLSEMLYRPSEIVVSEEDKLAEYEQQQQKEEHEKFAATAKQAAKEIDEKAKGQKIDEAGPFGSFLRKSSFLSTKKSISNDDNQQQQQPSPASFGARKELSSEEFVSDNLNNNKLKKNVTFIVGSGVKNVDHNQSVLSIDDDDDSGWISAINEGNKKDNTKKKADGNNQLVKILSSSSIRHEESSSTVDPEDDEQQTEEEEEPLQYPDGTTDHEILCDTFVIFVRNHLLPFLDTCFPWYSDPDISVVTTIPSIHNIVHREYQGMLKQLFALSSQVPTENEKETKYADLKKKAQKLNTEKNKNGSNALPLQGNSGTSLNNDSRSTSPSKQQQQQQQQQSPSPSTFSNVLDSTGISRLLIPTTIDEDAGVRKEDKQEVLYPEIQNNVISGVVLSRLLQSVSHFTHISQRDEKIVECTEQLIWACSLQHADHPGKTAMRTQWAQGHPCSPIVLWENAAVRSSQIDSGLIHRSEKNMSLVDYFNKHSTEARETKPAAIADYVEPLESLVLSYDGFLEAIVRMAIVVEIGRENALRFPRLDQVDAALATFFKRKVMMTCRDTFTSRLSPRDEMRASNDYEKKEGACVVRSVRLVARAHLLKEGPSAVHFHQVDMGGELVATFHRVLSVWVKRVGGGHAEHAAGSFVLPPLKEVLGAIIRSVDASQASSRRKTPLARPSPHYVNFRVTGRLISQSSLAVRTNFVHIFELAFGSFGKKWTAVPHHNVHQSSEANPPFSVTTPTAMFHREETAVFVRTRELILSSPPDACKAILRFARNLVCSARRCVSILLEASLFGEATKEHVKELMIQDEIGFALAQLLLGWNLCEARKDSPLLPGNESADLEDEEEEEEQDEDEDEEEDDNDSDFLDDSEDGDEGIVSPLEKQGRESSNLFSAIVTSSRKEPPSLLSFNKSQNNKTSSSLRRKSSSSCDNNNSNINFFENDFDPSKSMKIRLRRHSLNAENFASPKKKAKLVTATEALDMLVGGDAAKSVEWLHLMRNSRCQVAPAMQDNTEHFLDETSVLRVERAQTIEEFAAEVLQDILFCDAAWVARHEKKVSNFIEKARKGDASSRLFGSSSFLIPTTSLRQDQQQTLNSATDRTAQFSEHLTHHALFTSPSRQTILFATQVIKSASGAYRVKRSTARALSVSAVRRRVAAFEAAKNAKTLPGSSENNNFDKTLLARAPSFSDFASAAYSGTPAAKSQKIPRPPASPLTAQLQRSGSSTFSSFSLMMKEETERKTSSSPAGSSPSSPKSEKNHLPLNPDDNAVAKEISAQQDKALGIKNRKTYFDRALIFSMLTTAVTTERPGWSFFLVSRACILGSIGYGDDCSDVAFYRQEKFPSSYSVPPNIRRSIFAASAAAGTATMKPKDNSVTVGNSNNNNNNVRIHRTTAATVNLNRTVTAQHQQQNLLNVTTSGSASRRVSSASLSSSTSNNNDNITQVIPSNYCKNNNQDESCGNIIIVDNRTNFPKPWDVHSPFASLPRPVGFYSVHGERFPFVWTRPYCPGGDDEVRQILDLAARRISYSDSPDRYSLLLSDFIKTSIAGKKDIQLVGGASFHNLVPFSRTSSLLREANDHLPSSSVDYLTHPNSCKIYKIYLEDKLKSSFSPNVLFGVIAETNKTPPYPGDEKKRFSGPFSTLSFQIPHFNAANYAITLYSAVPLVEVIGWYREYVLGVMASESASCGTTAAATSDETMFGPFAVQDAYQPAVIACALHLFRDHARDEDSEKLRQELKKRGFIIEAQEK